jgi:hypothetical protein
LPAFVGEKSDVRCPPASAVEWLRFTGTGGAGVTATGATKPLLLCATSCPLASAGATADAPSPLDPRVLGGSAGDAARIGESAPLPLLWGDNAPLRGRRAAAGESARAGDAGAAPG